MAERNSTSTLLLVLIVLITLPFWFIIGGVVVGIVFGIIGGIFGIIGGIFGAIVGIFTWPFRHIFHDSHWGWFPHIHFHGFWLIVIILLIAFAVRGKK